MDRKKFRTLVIIHAFVWLVVGIIVISLADYSIGNQDEKDTKTSIYDVWIDMMKDTTPDDPLVVNTTREILGNDADGILTPSDVSKIQQWIQSNIEWKNSDTVLSPNETLTSRKGDCSEFSLLEYSMLLSENKNNDADVYICFVDFEDETGLVHHGNILVIFDDVLFLSDPSYQGDLNDMFQPVTNISKTVDKIIRWSNIKKYDIRGVFSHRSFCPFDDNDEFFGWCEYLLENENGFDYYIGIRINNSGLTENQFEDLSQQWVASLSSTNWTLEPEPTFEITLIKWTINGMEVETEFKKVLVN